MSQSRGSDTTARPHDRLERLSPCTAKERSPRATSPSVQWRNPSDCVPQSSIGFAGVAAYRPGTRDTLPSLLLRTLRLERTLIDNAAFVHANAARRQI